jgi:uncharacterized membrane protein
MMQFGVSLPSWILALLAAAVVVVAWLSYSGSEASLHRRRRATLAGLRAAALLALVVCLLRPVRVLPPGDAADAVVPILVDVSRSMSLVDADDGSRIDTARRILERQLVPALAGKFAPEVWTFGDSLQRLGDSSDQGAGAPARWTADARRSDLAGALRDVRERYRERRVAGIVVISDGGDTGAEDAAGAVGDGGIPVYTVGVGSPRGGIDYEVLDVAAGEAAAVDSAIDINVSAVSRGTDVPFDIRLLENGRPVDVRRVTPSGPSSPVRVVFTVSPPRDTATLYSVEIPSSSEETVVENNRRRVAVDPPGRVRRILMIAGAPGFEHSFLKRALDADPAIDLDSIVRKGRDTSGKPTYFIQAPAERAPTLTSGFPKDRAALYTYDAVLLANVEPDTLTRVQLEQLAAFVERRGGGLLVLGAKSFAQRGLAGTPLEEALPVNLSGPTVNAAYAGESRPGVNLTAAGAAHPAMRIAMSGDDAMKRWQAVPALAAASSVGEARPGAQVLALIRTPEGARPLVAVQRYGRGRSMVFAGEASWRWRMMLPSSDRTYELFWRHAARWLASSAPDPVVIPPMPALVPGDEAALGVEVRDGEFEPVANAGVTLRVTMPSGAAHDLRPTLVDPQTGRYSASVRFDEPGLYRVAADARRPAQTSASSQRWILVGAADRELTDPRLNQEVLRRVSRATGASYLQSKEISTLPALIGGTAPEAGAPRLQELWHSAWIFVFIVMLLSTEWVLRRRWGLR